ncbi:MAG: AbrB/MazE/SpoVT family DNA-binding domain-containing protein [Sphingomonadaceae bacterium]|nr:AbrB/MazE/SpoVT family DNA-binding domain-containing protein [Sphingomonadaceae bacterium]
MNAESRLSSKGQIVIPRDIREALGLRPGARMTFRRIGDQILMEQADAARETISYDDFKRRVPAYSGPPRTIDEMREGIARIFDDWKA